MLFSVLPVKAWVKMSMYDLAGRFVRDVMNSAQTRGNYSGSIDIRGISSQYYLLRVTINGATTVLKFRPLSRVQGADHGPKRSRISRPGSKNSRPWWTRCA